MAEGLFRHLTRERGGYQVWSAGVGAVNGQRPSPEAIQALQELGVDISNQRSRALTADLVERADYVFGMTQGHVDTVTLLHPGAAEKTFLLREFDDTLEGYEKDIPDPIGEGLDVYRECRDKIEQGIYSMLRYLERTGPAPERPLTVAVGADHAGFELKEAVRRHLTDSGVIVHDLGTASAESTDYPDYAQAVASAVAGGKAHFGVLMCSTGIGMSVAANKVPGIRAALVVNESGAELSRSHNDANVLCLGAQFTPPDQARRLVDLF
ncbi:partial Ribose-5-phosphate isomerase B, partial [uncultured bacterium]